MSRLHDEARDWRWSSTLRGIAIAVMIGVYAWFSGQPRGSLTRLMLVAAAIQVGVILLQRFVPADQLPKALYLFEMLVDGATVLCFALGVYTSIAHLPDV